MKKRAALLTIVYQEPFFFPLWLKYYSQFFASKDIFVMHLTKSKVWNDSSNVFDWAMQAQDSFIRIPYIHWSEDQFNEIQLKEVSKNQHLLLSKNSDDFNYDFVLYAEVDEIVWSPMGLDNYIDSMKVETARCAGFQVVQRLGEEPPLDPSRPIMQQRKYWYPSRLYSKPILSRVPCNWCTGFHWLKDDIMHTPDRNLLLLHLKQIDFDIYLSRSKARLKAGESLSDDIEKIRHVHGYQNKINESALKEYWNKSIDTGLSVETIDIPEYVRNGLNI